LFWYKILAFFSGYLVLVIRGSSLVKLVNLATCEGIYLWDLQKCGHDILVVKIGIQGFHGLRPLVRKTRSHVRIRERRGLPFFVQHIMARKVWFLGFISTVGLIIMFSSLVLIIRIEGANDPGGKLKKELYRYGVAIGANRGKIETKLEEIEQELQINHPEFLWVDAQLQGVLFRLKVVMRTQAPAEEGISEVVAAKDGLIHQMMVVSGTPIVKEGDTVAQGELLIASYQVMKDLDGNTVWKEVRAKGEVVAIVGYESEVIQPTVIWEGRDVEKKQTKIWLRVNQKLLPMFVWGRSPKTPHRRLTRKYLWKGRNPNTMVELIIDQATEVKWSRRRLTTSEAVALARRSAQEQLKHQIGPDGKANRYWEDWRIEGNLLIFCRTTELLEDISSLRWKKQ
jgi:similar to stage IV sporulation protein